MTTDIELHALRARRAARRCAKIEVIRPVFYQMSRAYVVGRITATDLMLPLVDRAQEHRARRAGGCRDARAKATSAILFSFTRSYFHVDLERVGEAVLFLKLDACRASR